MNTLYFDTASLAGGELEDLSTIVYNFYNGANTGGIPIREYIGVIMSGIWGIKIYDMSDVPPRVPIFVDGGTYARSSTSFPGEVAICHSFKAHASSGANPRRSRGRNYIGPLGLNAATSSAAPSPSTQLRTDLCTAAQRMHDEGETASIFWVVWSEADLDTVRVEEGWVDSAFDTQRRRGLAPQSRTTWGTT